MRTKIACLATLTLAIASGAAFAQETDWTGFYGGVSLATHDGTHDYVDISDLYDLEGSAVSVFAGRLWDTGILVYGAEIAASSGGVYEREFDGSESYEDEYEYTRFLDLKGRVGYDVKGVLVYGTLGVSRARFLSDFSINTNATGMVLGMGADYQLGDRYFVGAEYLRRNYDFYEPSEDSDVDADVSTFSLRAGIKF